jgi:hypothetical protein
VILSHHTAQALKNTPLKNEDAVSFKRNEDLLDTDLQPTRTAMESPSGVWEAAPTAFTVVICFASCIGFINGLEYKHRREVGSVSGEALLSH